MEGIITEITKGEHPIIDPYAWVQVASGAGFQTVRYWSIGKTSKSYWPGHQRAEIHERFMEIFSSLQAACAAKPIKVIQDIVNDKTSPAGVRVEGAKYWAGHAWPERYGSTAAKFQVEVTAEPAVSETQAFEISQEVFDAMTNDEVIALEQYQAEIDEHQAEIDERQPLITALLETVRGRIS